jgi:hypothetical protein
MPREDSARFTAGQQGDAPSALPRARLRFLAGQLHRLGERPLYEFLREIEAGAPLHERLERYAELWPLRSFIQTWGGDRLPPPARLVGRRRGGEDPEAEEEAR